MSTLRYPGTATLAADVKQRVLTTFRHTLDLARQGNNEEASVGCNFVLQLDPMFEPARKLLDKIENPFSSVQLEELEEAIKQDDLPPIEAARAALAARDFTRAMEITSDLLRADLMNLEAQQLAEEAQSKLEAGPFIDQFVKSANAKIAQGNTSGALTDLAKARQLDDTHPMVLELESRLHSASNAPTQPVDVGGFSSPFSSGFGEASDFAAPPAAETPFGSTSDAGFNPFAESASPAFAPFDSSTPAPADAFSTPDAFGSGSVPSFQPPADEGFGFSTPAADSNFGFAPPAAPAAPQGGFGFESTPSFVVDGGAPSAGPAATDFGFTFEEDKPAADPGLGSIAAPFAPQIDQESVSRGAGNTFDFATASVETTAEDQQKIAAYLREGDALYDGGDFQRAIDTWSKIFLIDVTNDDASQRIERARLKRLESDRRVEELVVAGTLAFEKGDIATARTKFEQVLQLDPNHFNAREYLDRIESGATETLAPSAAPSTSLDDFDDDFGDPSGVSAPPLVPPDPSAPRAAKEKAPAAAAAAPKKKLPVVPLAIIVGLLLLAGGGYFAYTRLSPQEQSNPAETAAVFSRAQRLAQQGKYDEAIAALSAVKPDDPEHDRALEMIADLKNQKAQTSGMINGRPSAEVFAGLVNQGRQSFANKDYLTAKQAFEQASTIQALPPDVKQMLDASTQQVAKLDSAIVLLKEGRFDEGITNLRGLEQQDPGNVAIRSLLNRAYFNAGATAMQQEQTGAAMAQFDEALKLNPNDAEAKRSRELAQKYDGAAKDLMYRIYVKYLPLRTF